MQSTIAGCLDDLGAAHRPAAQLHDPCDLARAARIQIELVGVEVAATRERQAERRVVFIRACGGGAHDALVEDLEHDV